LILAGQKENPAARTIPDRESEAEPWETADSGPVVLVGSSPWTEYPDSFPATHERGARVIRTGLFLGCGLNEVALEEGVFGVSQGGIAAAALHVGEIGSDAGAVLKGGVILKMKMEVGLAGIPAVAADGEHLARADLVAAADA